MIKHEWHRITAPDLERRLGACSVCGPDTRFRARKGRSPQCMTVRRRHRRLDQLHRRYGIDRAMWDALVLAQEGRCALCSWATPALVVDHCHVTGRVRGLLCRACNLAIARLGDDAGGALRLLAYMTATPDRTCGRA